MSEELRDKLCRDITESECALATANEHLALLQVKDAVLNYMGAVGHRIEISPHSQTPNEFPSENTEFFMEVVSRIDEELDLIRCEYGLIDLQPFDPDKLD
jgi:hypothetical protein